MEDPGKRAGRGECKKEIIEVGRGRIIEKDTRSKSRKKHNE